MSLELLTPGDRGEIIEVKHCGGCGGGCHDNGLNHVHAQNGMQKKATRAEEMGFRTGKRVEMLKNDGNLLLVLVDGARITIDRRMAMNILVRR